MRVKNQGRQRCEICRVKTSGVMCTECWRSSYIRAIAKWNERARNNRLNEQYKHQPSSSLNVKAFNAYE